MKIVTNVPEELLKSNADEATPGSASLIAYAETTEDVSRFLKEAYENNTKVITIGSHTGLAGATYPQDGEAFLSLELMNQIIELDEETLTLTVEAGVTLNQIREYLSTTPYFYAPDPGAKDATVGGNASTNAGGMRAIKYGVTRDNIRGMEVVLADGQILTVGSKNRKDASGYALKDLFIGAEGTLGVITKLQLEIRPVLAYELSLLIGFDDLNNLAPVIFEILRAPISPVALELLDESSVKHAEVYTQTKMTNQAGRSFLLLTVNSNNQEGLQLELENLEQVIQASGALSTRILNAQEAKAVWHIRDNILNGIYAASTTKMYDPVVPVNRTPELLIKSKELGEQLGVETAFFGHAGDGNLHICILKFDMDDDQWKTVLATYTDKMNQLVASMEGLPSAEHGIGLEKKPYVKYFFDEGYIAVLRKIKLALDPKAILNPDRIFDL
ncbi:FAD-binding oxidoreductase [Fundicoccus culcitae]|uniref:FAD-binding oxidoreductase n=1 Tax=Fundicoccus culcitae TaxID=2969821 RepID=A0ABY5P878_9LACT|nr:FAD-binding oxidoreductase [Fundicoccus culcitae]UUX34795.1 FAD-binding oxidoreductase [Fundicoccus culcitae]